MSTPALQKRSKRPDTTGVSPKNADLLIVHSKAKDMTALDGTIKINLAKFMLVQLTEVRIKELGKGYKDSDGNVLTTKHYECQLHLSSLHAHPQFVLVGANTGNLKRHAKTHHSAVMDAIVRLVEEMPKDDAADVINQYIVDTQLPQPKMTRFFKQVSADLGSVLVETRALLWFLDAQVAFVQFDNPLFKSFVQSFRSKELPSSSTMTAAILPSIYSYCTKFMVSVLQEAVAYHTSWDGWSAMGSKFVSQTYHTISAKTFKFHMCLLDLIPFSTAHYAEVFAGALIHRQEHWTGSIVPLLLVGGAMADAESKGQAAG
jgi:hypothetical protein